ncbi:hypothetical protein EDB87DRAFT_1583196, partial [Lactarius vividus]
MPRKTRTITKAALPKQAEHKFGSKATAHVQDGGKAAPTKTTKKVGRKAAQAGPSSTNATRGGDIQEAPGFIQWWDEYKDQLSSLFSDYQVATLFIARVQVEDYQDNLLADLDDVRYSYDGDLAQYVEDNFIKTFMPRDDAREEYADDPTWEDPKEDQDPEDDQRRDPEEDRFPQEGPEYDGGEWENHGDEPDYEEDADPKEAGTAREDAQDRPDWSLLLPCYPGEGDGRDDDEDAWTDEESEEERHELSPSHTSDPADDATDPWTDKGEMFHDGHSQTPWDPPEWREDEDDTTEDEDEFMTPRTSKTPWRIDLMRKIHPKAIRKRVQFAPSAKSQPPPQYFENVDTFVPPIAKKHVGSGGAASRQELAQAQESSWYPFRDHIDGMDTRPGRIRVNAAKIAARTPSKEALDPLLKSAIVSFLLLDPSNFPPKTAAVRRGRLPKKE